MASSPSRRPARSGDGAARRVAPALDAVWPQSSGQSRKEAAGKEAKADLKITALEVTNDVASAKVVETYPGSRYTDYLSLVRINGKWQIVNKVYTEQKAAK